MLSVTETARNELDFLVISLKHMRTLPPLEAQEFRTQMENYFQLGQEMRSSFVWDELIRLSNVQAGTLKPRSTVLLDRLHQLSNGDRFTFDGKECIFRAHHGGDDPRNGFFIYVDQTYTEHSMDYNEAWTHMANGKLHI